MSGKGGNEMKFQKGTKIRIKNTSLRGHVTEKLGEYSYIVQITEPIQYSKLQMHEDFLEIDSEKHDKDGIPNSFYTLGYPTNNEYHDPFELTQAELDITYLTFKQLHDLREIYIDMALQTRDFEWLKELLEDA